MDIQNAIICVLAYTKRRLTVQHHRHTLTDDEKAEYIRAEKCLMSRPAKLGINGTENRWDELQMSHIIQINDIHDVGQF